MDPAPRAQGGGKEAMPAGLRPDENEGRLYRAIVEDQADFICRALPDATALFVNEAWCRYVGRSREELIGQSFMGQIAEEDREQVRRALASLSPQSPVVFTEMRIRRSDGTLGWTQWVDRGLFDDEGRMACLQGGGRDISDRKRAEEQLRVLNESLEERVAERTAIAEARAQQLRKLAAELTRAEQRERQRLAEVLHDNLQQVLVAARYNIGVARARIPPADRQTHRSLDRANALVAESLEVSRSLSVELSPPILRDAGLGPAIVWLAKRLRDESGLTVEVEPRVAELMPEHGVATFLFQAVRELLLNVTKHAAATHVRVGGGVTDVGRIRIEVVDAGRGFNPARLSYSSDAGGPGGFGLMAIRERLSLLGGHLAIESAPGRGTRVALTVPAAPARTRDADLASVRRGARPEPARAAAQTTPDTTRVVVVDDHSVVRTALVALLEQEPDIRVVGDAADGKAAVEMVQRLEPDVVLMDVSMPVINGIEATRRITAERPSTRVIGLSMYPAREQASAMLGAGAAAYLSKAGISTELIAAIRSSTGAKARRS